MIFDLVFEFGHGSDGTGLSCRLVRTEPTVPDTLVDVDWGLIMVLAAPRPQTRM